ncbi:aldehyde dehydrogenase [Leptolyngbya sp. NIES-2104]|nr:aldehyde dehydrogenase [Leptolyngbya sp. NIES-2104]
MISKRYTLLDAEAKVKDPSLYLLESTINRRSNHSLAGLPVVAQWDIVADDALNQLVQSQLQKAQVATQALRRIPLETRIQILQDFGTKLRAQYAKWRTLTVQESYAYNAFLASLDAVLETFQSNYFDLISNVLQPISKLGCNARLEHVPQGVIGVISPQNSSFPMLTQILHGAFLSGNALLIKPPHRLAIVALALVDEFNQVLKDWEMPNHLVSTVVHPNHQSILDSWLGLKGGSRIDNLVFIGNSKRRSEIIQSCQQAGIYNPIIELEGVDSAYVHHDLTPEQLSRTACLLAYAKNAASGQFCISLKRLYVHPDVYEPLMTALRTEFQRYRPGSLREDDPYVLGPSSLPHKLPSIVDAFEAAGATTTVGGRRLNYQGQPDPDGIYIEPTLFEGVDPTSELLKEEIFANVLPVVKTNGNLADTIEHMNQCPFGLRGTVFAQDKEVIEEMRHRLNVGTVVINGNPLDFSIQIAGGRGASTLDQHARIWAIDLSLRQVVTGDRGIRDLADILQIPEVLPLLEHKVIAADLL